MGAVNFLTGMGGFLQAVLHGYGGLRLHAEHVDFNPRLPPGTTALRFVLGLKAKAWRQSFARVVGVLLGVGMRVEFKDECWLDTVSGVIGLCPLPILRRTVDGNMHACDSVDIQAH